MSNLLRLLNRREFAHPSLAVLSRKGTLPSPLVSSPALISLYLSPTYKHMPLRFRHSDLQHVLIWAVCPFIHRLTSPTSISVLWPLPDSP